MGRKENAQKEKESGDVDMATPIKRSWIEEKITQALRKIVGK